VAVAVIAVCVAVLHFATDPQVQDLAEVVQLVVLCGLPLAFVVGKTVGAFGRAGEVEEVARGLSEASAEPALLDDLMVRALGDPSARVVWAAGADRDCVVDSEGTPFGVRQDRGWWPIGADRPPAGGLLYDADLVADTGLVATVAAPLALAIDNRRLVVELRSALHQLHLAAEDVRTSRRRIVVAADAERRRIAQDLHDGAQQRIVVVGMEVQRLARRADDADLVRSVVARVAALCELLLDELRGLVQGIMPSRLQERGLEAAVVALADQLPVRVRVDVATRLERMDAEVESTGYFVVAEALTNAMKHAGASEIVVAIAARNGRLRIEVTDDGRGPADADLGFGLRSLRDRVETLDGTLALVAAHGRGTTLRAEFACA
jgi:signal transduction histidine kinase